MQCFLFLLKGSLDDNGEKESLENVTPSAHLLTEESTGKVLSESSRIKQERIDFRYELLYSLGEGGMGEVFAAKDLSEGGICALKLLSDVGSEEQSNRLEKRMKREVKVLSVVQHENLIKLFASGKDPKRGLYYTMELLPQSETLGSVLDRGKFSFLQGLHVVSQILSGLSALHSHQVLHRDLKSSNILCIYGQNHEDVQVKLIDLGIARWLDNDLRTQITVETETGILLGSPPYMAPEMWRSEAVDVRTDLYQVGILTFEILSGKLPFVGSPHQLMFQHLHSFVHEFSPKFDESEGVSSAELVAATNALVKHATQKDPDARFQTTACFQKAIDDLISFFKDDRAVLEVSWIKQPTLSPPSKGTFESTLELKKNVLLSYPLRILLLVVFCMIFGLFAFRTLSKSTPKSMKNTSLGKQVKKRTTSKIKESSKPVKRAHLLKTGEQGSKKLQNPLQRVIKKRKRRKKRGVSARRVLRDRRKKGSSSFRPGLQEHFP